MSAEFTTDQDGTPVRLTFQVSGTSHDWIVTLAHEGAKRFFGEQTYLLTITASPLLETSGRETSVYFADVEAWAV